MEDKMIVWQISLNPKNVSHRKLMDWVNSQTTNRSSFIREALIMRMYGELREGSVNEGYKKQEEIDKNEVLRLIEV